MKSLKMSLDNIQGKMSRDEMKSINGGKQQPVGGSCTGIGQSDCTQTSTAVYLCVNGKCTYYPQQ
jgi:hypothetical protein